MKRAVGPPPWLSLQLPHAPVSVRRLGCVCRLWASSRGSELQRKAGRLNRAGCPPSCRHLCCLPTWASFCGNPDERGGLEVRLRATLAPDPPSEARGPLWACVRLASKVLGSRAPVEYKGKTFIVSPSNAQPSQRLNPWGI